MVVSGAPSIYSWTPAEKNPEIPGGAFMFSRDEDGDLILLSLVPFVEGFSSVDEEGTLLGLKFKVEVDGKTMRWSTSNGDKDIVTTAVVSGGEIRGTTQIIAGGRIEEGSRYDWVAVHEMGPRL